MYKIINEERIQTDYIAKRHYTQLKEYLEHTFKSSQSRFPYIVSFRHTGKDSTRMLEAGAAAKPHSILDKTIKEGAMTAEEAAYAPLVLLHGLTAYRERNDSDIQGLYAVVSDTKYVVRRRGQGEDLCSFIAGMTRLTWDEVHALEGMKKEDILELMKQPDSRYYAANYAMDYIAGDYDLHDLLKLTSHIHPVPSDGDEEIQARNELNSIFMTGTKDSIKGLKAVKNLHFPVQHGPQYNYIAYMYNAEPTQQLVKKVAAADFPIAVLNTRSNQIVWTEIDNIDDLKRYYETNYAVMKYSWDTEYMNYIAERVGKSFEEYMRVKRSDS